MSMAGMNPAAAGGAVGGNMMMPDGGAAMQSLPGSEKTKAMLNTYIYEYFLKIGLHDVARSLHQQEKFKFNTKPKQSPGRRKDGEANGENDAMDVDKIALEIPDDLPPPALDSTAQGDGFLVEWFSIFSDLFIAARNPKQANMGAAQQYLMHAQNTQRMRESQQNPGMMRPGMMNPNAYAMRANMRNGMVNGAAMPGAEMTKRMTPQQLQTMMQQKQMHAQQQQQQQQQQREAGDLDMNGRPGTPAEGDNGSSPSKRPRLEGQQFNGPIMVNGRPMPAGVPQGMMIQNAFNPQQMNPQFRPNGGMPQQKPMQPGIPNGAMMNMNNAGSPSMMVPMTNAQFGADASIEMYNNGRMGGQMPGAAPQSGNHALQDYQMQLMLLEQQNKKRLMMARQEQDNQVQRDGAPMPGMGAPGMSPSGSRTGTSPNPADQMKRTPQLGGLPGSPSAGENMQGRSPTPMGFMNGNMPVGDFNPNPMFMGDKQGMGGPGGPNMRPPTSMQMQGRMAGQFQGGQPMAQQPSQGGQQPMGTPGQRNEMPPPQAPAGGVQRTASSPAQSGSNAPPTPSQANKPNPKNKKGKDDSAANNTANNKKKPAKKNSQANNVNDSQPAPGATPTAPSAPVQQMPPVQNQMQQSEMPQNNFPNFDGSDQPFNLDFSTLDNTDVLENFDFDSFLNTSADDNFSNFEASMVGGEFSLDTGGD